MSKFITPQIDVLFVGSKLWAKSICVGYLNVPRICKLSDFGRHAISSAVLLAISSRLWIEVVSAIVNLMLDHAD